MSVVVNYVKLITRPKFPIKFYSTTITGGRDECRSDLPTEDWQDRD